MDNRLTRRRLFDLLSYEWIFMIVMCVVAIVFWELIYSVTSVKLTPGQDFKIYYDYTLSSTSDGELRQLIVERKTFSYDVLKFGAEDIDRNNNVLSSRLSIQEGDIIFTDAVGIKEYNEAIKKGETPENPIRAFSVIDTPSCRIASLDEMLSNAQVYLKINFFKDGYNEQTVFDSYDSQNIDHAKVRSAFLKRNGKDNRFRSSSNKEQGIKLEIERIEKLYENVVFMRKFINDNQDSEALVKYTKYSQACIFSIGAAGDYESRLEKEKLAGREHDIYGINLGKLSGGRNITDFIQYKLGGDLTDIVVLAFDFTYYQPDLQYESLSFICSMIKICTGIN